MNEDTIILNPELISLEVYIQGSARVLAITMHTGDLGTFLLPVSEKMAAQLSRSLDRFSRQAS